MSPRVWLRLSARVLYRRDNVGISAAPADIAVHCLLHVVVGGSDRLLEKCNSGHDLARGAVAALVSIMLDKRSLHRMQMVRLPDPFDRDNLIRGMHHGERETGVYPAAVDVNCTRTTLAMITTLFGTGKVEIFAKAVEKSGAGIKLKMMILTIDPQFDGDGPLDENGRILRGRSRGRRRSAQKRWRGRCNAGSPQV
jgi:hypothetical protein